MTPSSYRCGDDARRELPFPERPQRRQRGADVGQPGEVPSSCRVRVTSPSQADQWSARWPSTRNSYLDQVTAAHQGRADEYGVALWAATRGNLEVTADPARLRRAHANLVANAVRHTPRGGKVTVVGRCVAGTIVLEVVDTGVGISAEDLPHVFDRFWRADTSRSRRHRRQRARPRVTRHIVEAHGGTVPVQSVPGEGSTFRLVLPATESLPTGRAAAGQW
jgi:signal transduction histidine kinase